MKKSILFLSIIALTSCSSDNQTTEEITSEDVVSVDYQHIGDSLTNLAMQELLANVQREMQAGGPTQAVDFCNIHAMPLMDSLSNSYGATITRVSEKNRNPQNAANEIDLEVLNYLEANQAKDSLLTSEANPTYYKTIKLGMPACIKCHGIPNEDISPETVVLLNERYPNDKATGYKPGEFRGAWKVVFN